MTDTQYTSHLLDNQVQTGPNASWALTIAAAALALLIGLSAADTQKSEDPVRADQVQTSKQDGRGKWAGYM